MYMSRRGHKLVWWLPASSDLVKRRARQPMLTQVYSVIVLTENSRRAAPLERQADFRGEETRNCPVRPRCDSFGH